MPQNRRFVENRNNSSLLQIIKNKKLIHTSVEIYHQIKKRKHFCNKILSYPLATAELSPLESHLYHQPRKPLGLIVRSIFLFHESQSTYPINSIYFYLS